MSRLITDPTVRLIFQGLVLAVLAGLAAVAILSCVVLGARVFGITWPYMTELVSFIIQMLALPLTDTFGQAVAMIIALFPVVFSAVCFVVDTATTPPKVSAQLNRVGHAALVILLIGAASWLILLGIFQLNFALIGELAEDQAQAALAKGTTGGVLVFQANYLAVILGVNSGQILPKAAT